MKLLDVLAVVFIVLKLVGVITWSWWWVFSPLWASILIWLLLSIYAAYLDYQVKHFSKHFWD